MNEGSDIPPSPDIEPIGNTDTVPLDVLGMPDETEQMTPPEVGDEVSYQVTGKITAINGGVATIERTTINGKSVDDGDGDAVPDESDLQAEAKQQDSAQFGG